MTPAMRLAKKELRALGCELVKKESHKLVFRLLNGAQWVAHTGTTHGRVQEVVDAQAKLAGRLTDDAFKDYGKAHSAPVLKAGDFEAGAHFKQRLSEMRAQGLRYPEVEAALLRPVEVRKSAHDRFLYCGERIAVVVAPGDSKHALVTILWATKALFDMYPRPEKRRRNSDRYRNQPPGTYRD